MANTTDIKKGAVIRHQGDLYVVTFCQFVNPGKGAAFTKTKMKGISSSKSIEMTYKNSETIDIVQVQRTNMQYLYQSGNNYSFMDQSNYETVDINADVIGDDKKYLKDGLVVIVSLNENIPVAVELPKK